MSAAPGRTARACTIRVLVATCLAGLLAPAPAAADVLLTPFWGVTFGGTTTLIDLEQASGSAKSGLGGLLMVLGTGIVGIEGDFGYSPRFFETDNRLVASSSVTTLGGNVVIAVPSSITRESRGPTCCPAPAGSVPPAPTWRSSCRSTPTCSG